MFLGPKSVNLLVLHIFSAVSADLYQKHVWLAEIKKIDF